MKKNLNKIKDLKYGNPEKKVQYQELEVIQKTISIYQQYWNPQEIFELLKRIESEDGFKGFVKLHFEVGEFPQITYYVNYKKEE